VRRSRGLVLACILLGAVARAEPTARPGTLDALIERSGLDTQLARFQALVQQDVTHASSQGTALSETELARLRRAVATAYAPAGLQRALRVELARQLDGAEIAAALAWIESPTGRKLAALERQASTPEAQASFEERANRVVPALGPGRRELLDGLIRATRADELGASLLIASSLGVAEGFAQLQSPAPRPPRDVLRRQLESRRAQIVAALRNQYFRGFAVVYAAASDAELEALLAFARSPLGARYHAASFRAIENVLAGAARQIGGAVASPGGA
jgi:hypothetical protein